MGAKSQSALAGRWQAGMRGIHVGELTDEENGTFSESPKVMTRILRPRCRSHCGCPPDRICEAPWPRLRGSAVENFFPRRTAAIATKRLFHSDLACCGIPDSLYHLHRHERAPKLQWFRHTCARRPAVQPALTPTLGPRPGTEDPPRAAVAEPHRIRSGCGSCAPFGPASPAARRPSR